MATTKMRLDDGFRELNDFSGNDEITAILAMDRDQILGFELDIDNHLQEKDKGPQYYHRFTSIQQTVDVQVTVTDESLIDWHNLLTKYHIPTF